MTRALAMAFLLTAAAASAYEGRAEGDSARRPREEIFQMVDGYVADHLQEKLGLSDEQLPQVLPLVRKLSADRRRFAENRIRVIRLMRKMMKAGAANDARIAELLQQVKAAEVEEPAAIRAGHDAIDALLTPVQQVRFRILDAEIEHRLRQVMARVRGERYGTPDHPRGKDAPRP